MDKTSKSNSTSVEKKLDIITAILLTRGGLNRKDVAETLGVSEKTIERMFHGKFNKIHGDVA